MHVCKHATHSPAEVTQCRTPSLQGLDAILPHGQTNDKPGVYIRALGKKGHVHKETLGPRTTVPECQQFVRCLNPNVETAAKLRSA